MPELPEVEDARRRLERWTQGRRVERAHAADTRVFRGTTPQAVTSRLHGRRVREVRRRGKYLLMVLDDGGGVLMHLGMTGHVVRRKKGEPHPDRSHLDLMLDDGHRVHYVCTRLLGRITAGDLETLTAEDPWASLGLDPVADGLTPARLRDALGDGERPVKLALMDQKRLAGVGNIQAAEALWRARIHPKTPLSALDRNAWARLARGVLGTLEDTIAGITGEDVQYVEEGAENPFDVYGKAGEPCPRCGAAIEKLTQGGRTTFYCPACQTAR